MTHPDPIDVAPLPLEPVAAMAANHTTERLRRARWSTRGLFLSLGMLGGIWGVHIPSIKDAYQLNPATLSWALLAVAMGAVSALLFAGRVIGRLGPRDTARLAAVVMGVLLALVLHWPSFVWLLPFMWLLGACMSLFDVSINTEGSALESYSHKPIMGNLHGSFSAGGMAGALFAGQMIQWQWAPAWQLGLTGALTAAWVLWSASGMLPAHPAPDAADAPEANTGFRWPRGTLLLLGLLCFAGMSAEGAMYDWSVLYLQQEVGMPHQQAAWGYAAFSAAMAVSRFGGDALRLRFDERLLLRTGAWMTATALLLLLLYPHPWIALPAYAVIGMGLSMVVPLLFNAATRIPGQSRADAIASVSAIGYSGFLLGPPLIGGVAHLSSLSWGMATMIPMAMLLALGSRRIPAAPTQHP